MGEPDTSGIPFPSEDWIETYQRHLNDNDAYAAAAEGWGVGFDGDFVFEIRPDEVYHGDPVCFHVCLEDGECLAVAMKRGVRSSEYGFAIRGEYSDWKRVLRGELSARSVATGGTFDVEGSKLKVLQYADAATEMIETATRVETTFEH